MAGMIPKLNSKSGLEDRFCCFYWLEGDRPSAPWLSGPPSSVVSTAAQAAKIDKLVNGEIG